MKQGISILHKSGNKMITEIKNIIKWVGILQAKAKPIENQPYLVLTRHEVARKTIRWWWILPRQGFLAAC